VHQLRLLDYDLDIICGLKGRYTQSWDTHIRPVPARARLISLDEALTSRERYACIIAHNPTDLLDIRSRTEPRILMLHLSLEARIVEEHSDRSPEQAKQILHRYVRLGGVHVVAVTHRKGESWGFPEDIVPAAVDPDDYPPYTAETACGLRISNFILQRKKFLLWSFHEQAFAGLPVRIVGHNPGMPGVAASRDWDHLKDLLRTSRFYIHTADPALEDGYNIAMMEAMAAGMPVLANRHPTSIIQHGVDGFVSDDPAGLRNYARLLLEDRDLALRMGRQARFSVQRRFSSEAFRCGMERAIASAGRERELLTLHGPDMAAALAGASTDRPPHATQPKPAIVELPRPSERRSPSPESKPFDDAADNALRRHYKRSRSVELPHDCGCIGDNKCPRGFPRDAQRAE
jgi:hypothetical protein